MTRRLRPLVLLLFLVLLFAVLRAALLDGAAREEEPPQRLCPCPGYQAAYDELTSVPIPAPDAGADKERLVTFPGPDPLLLAVEFERAIRAFLGDATPMVLVEGGYPSKHGQTGEGGSMMFVPLPEEVLSPDAGQDKEWRPDGYVVRRAFWRYDVPPPDFSSAGTVAECLSLVEVKTPYLVVRSDNLWILQYQDARLRVEELDRLFSFGELAGRKRVNSAELIRRLRETTCFRAPERLWPIATNPVSIYSRELGNAPRVLDVLGALLRARDLAADRTQVYQVYHSPWWDYPVGEGRPVRIGYCWMVSGRPAAAPTPLTHARLMHRVP